MPPIRNDTPLEIRASQWKTSPASLQTENHHLPCGPHSADNQAEFHGVLTGNLDTFAEEYFFNFAEVTDVQ